MKRKLLSRASKAECLKVAARNKTCPPGLAHHLQSEAFRHLDAAKIHGDKMSTRMTGNQTAKE